MKEYYIVNLREGSKIEDVFLVSSKTVASTRAGSPYLKLKLVDKTGVMDGVKWDASESDIARVNEDGYIYVHGTVKSYNGDTQLTIDTLSKCSDAIDPSDFIACTMRNRDNMLAELKSILSNIQNPSLLQLLNVFFNDEAFLAKFYDSPAATKLHHAYIGGLLEHTLNVVKNAVALAALYPFVDRDLLITAAALHDIAKVDEFSWSGSIKYSNMGQLVGHVVGGAMMVREVAEKIDGFDPLLSLALQHALLAHHGQMEYGSPKLPSSYEALLLHTADDLDAQVAIFTQAIEDSDRNGDESLFTKRHFLLNRPIFKGIPETENELKAEPAEDSFNIDMFAAEPSYDPFADE